MRISNFLPVPFLGIFSWGGGDQNFFCKNRKNVGRQGLPEARDGMVLINPITSGEPDEICY